MKHFEEFVKWSPYYIECNFYNGNYHTGSKVRFCEIVIGLDYDVTGTITECGQDENHFRIVFQSDKKTEQLDKQYPNTVDVACIAHARRKYAEFIKACRGELKESNSICM